MKLPDKALGEYSMCCRSLYFEIKIHVWSFISEAQSTHDQNGQVLDSTENWVKFQFELVAIEVVVKT